MTVTKGQDRGKKQNSAPSDQSRRLMKAFDYLRKENSQKNYQLSK